MGKKVEAMLKLYDGPDNSVAKVIKYREKHLTSFVEDTNGFIQIFEHSFELLVYSIELVNYIDKKNFKDHNLLQYLYIKNSLVFLYGSFDSLGCGFVNVANSGARSLFETLMRIYFMSFNQEDYQGVLGSMARGQFTKRFNISELIRDDLENNWMKIYNVLSLESHSNSKKVVSDWKKYCEGKPMYFELEKDEIMEKYNSNITLMLIYAFLVFLNDIIFYEYEVESEEMQKSLKDFNFDMKMKTTLAGLEELLDSVDESKYDNLYKEVNDVMIKIKVIEGKS